MKKIIVAVIILVILGISVVVYIYWPQDYKMTQQQKEESLTKLLGRKVDLSQKKAPEKVNYSDKFVSFDYPGQAIIYNYKDPGFASESGLLSSFSFDMHNPRVVFNYAAISRNNINSLDDDSSYRLRTLPERGYKKSNIKVGGLGGVLFQKNDTAESERSIFIFYKKTLYSFVTTGDQDAIENVMNLISSSLKFQ